MQYRQLPGTDLNVSALCLGTMTFGEQNSEADAHAQLDAAVAGGINFVDTAEMYPVPANGNTQGRTEEYVGSWLEKQPRDQIVLATKVAGPNRGMAWIRGGPQFTAAQIEQACNDSLRRLRTDYIDLYQVHWPARAVPMFGNSLYDPADEKPDTPSVHEQLEALTRLVQAGKVRHLGVSNETAWGVAEWGRVADAHGLPRVRSIQNVYNLINRAFESGLVEACHREQVALLVYSPLAFGLLSGKYITGDDRDGRMTRFPQFGVRYRKPFVDEAVAAYAALAREHGLTPAQLALAFVRSRWFVATTIIGATTMAQLAENIGSSEIVISAELEAGIEKLYRQYQSPAL
ncbi:Predicted oxidoreductase [Andreprevotia lacus DSM 23236]|jgi:aryl-alcohol dehydrogenase-like predicted oxidoreductase|uniref:Protein tas n=1 Tax=Andreprevotia lacus DSM 23236 TaxID=1121001 RepID=A0A1W1XQV8_9NEIS|nr:aldo/keto reductase [Andreprevotia lacus]SMC26370.1 Predicted oxidoreductase [Andreprevotia lacus DSM 23236]